MQLEKSCTEAARVGYGHRVPRALSGRSHAQAHGEGTSWPAGLATGNGASTLLCQPLLTFVVLMHKMCPLLCVVLLLLPHKPVCVWRTTKLWPNEKFMQHFALCFIRSRTNYAITRFPVYLIEQRPLMFIFPHSFAYIDTSISHSFDYSICFAFGLSAWA